MDGYPLGSVDHNVPFLVASGLLSTPRPELPLDAEPNDQAIFLRSDLPALDTKEAKVLAQYLGDIDGRQDAWNGRDQGDGYKFKVLTTGRTYLLPPRRARLPPHIEQPLSPAVLHSPFSPLSPSSPLYPDGIMNSQWLQKHQELVPSLFVTFYALECDDGTSAGADARLKTDIAGIRSALAKSGYRTRLIVVLLGERQSSPFHENIHERLDGIRKGAGLDPKTVFYIPPQDSPTDLIEAADGILTAMFAQAVEYYRDIGRHARKKRGRGTAPQPTVSPTVGTSQTLSLPGWHIRYDFKSAVFAEFRQEMDVALRSFEKCYGTLLGVDVLEIIPSWSPRWNEARLLADVTAIRCLRCLLWAGMTTTAVRRWQSHRYRIKDLVDRRGRGTSNYGWEAWEARWALVMAQVVERVSLQPFETATLALYILPEKGVLGERIRPWEMLHHTGYWYRAAATHVTARRALANSIPDEDRHSPDSSPASRVASRTFTYDTYLCPEPHEEHPLLDEGFNHSQMIVHCLMEARTQFQLRGQHRTVAELTLQAAQEMLRLKAWDEVVAILRPLWESMLCRTEGWWLIVEDVGWTLREAAVRAGRGDLILAIDWELLDRRFTRHANWHYDITRSLEGLTPGSGQKTVARTDDSAMSPFVSATFAFRNKQGRSGELCRAQLSISSNAHPDSTPVKLGRLRIEFEESLAPVILKHSDARGESGSQSSKDPVAILQISLEKEGGTHDEEQDTLQLRSAADLLLIPGQTKVYEFEIPLRDPGPAQAVSVALSVQTEAFDLVHNTTLVGGSTGGVWYGPLPSQSRRIRPDSHTIDVQPRPPKLEIRNAQTQQQQFYTNEAIHIPLELYNAEDDCAEAKLAVFLFGEPLQAFQVTFHDTSKMATTSLDGSVVSAFPVGTIASRAKIQAVARLAPVESPTSYEVMVKVSYHLVSEPATPIIQSTTLRLDVVNVFEANFDMLPRLHIASWPSIFSYECAEDQGGAIQTGLAQKWCLNCHYASFAADGIEVVGMDSLIGACVGGTAAVVSQRPNVPPAGLEVAPHTPQEAEFDLVVRKPSVDDRGPVTMDVAFVIKWRRKATSGVGPDQEPAPVNTTTIPVPQRYVVLGTEPRVLASVMSTNARTGLVALEITIENGSSHFLAFGVTMEPSDEFAFSGPKQTTLHVLPVSRRTVSYRIVALSRGKFVRLPMSVKDKYFQKVLRVLPTEGMKSDKEGLLLWIPPPVEEGETVAGVRSDVCNGRSSSQLE